jgi:uncharacterized membrane protein YphA (DoxX/SURF4 family)
MVKLGYRPTAPIAYLIIFIETVGALCVIFGLFTLFFAAGLCIESLVLIFGVKWGNGYAANHDGCEMLLIWAIVFFAIALRGGGPLLSRSYVRPRVIGFTHRTGVPLQTTYATP